MKQRFGGQSAYHINKTDFGKRLIMFLIIYLFHNCAERISECCFTPLNFGGAEQVAKIRSSQQIFHQILPSVLFSRLFRFDIFFLNINRWRLKAVYCWNKKPSCIRERKEKIF